MTIFYLDIGQCDIKYYLDNKKIDVGLYCNYFSLTFDHTNHFRNSQNEIKSYIRIRTFVTYEIIPATRVPGSYSFKVDYEPPS